VNAYQRGSTNGIRSNNLESWYIDGVSLTHGAAGSRQHIWTFAATSHETVSGAASCACDTSARSAFFNTSYFCDTGNHMGRLINGLTVFSDDPLWDGAGCSFNNTCCQVNNPPWFCTTLPAATTDNLELRKLQYPYDEIHVYDDIDKFNIKVSPVKQQLPPLPTTVPPQESSLTSPDTLPTASEGYDLTPCPAYVPTSFPCQGSAEGKEEGHYETIAVDNKP